VVVLVVVVVVVLTDVGVEKETMQI